MTEGGSDRDAGREEIASGSLWICIHRDPRFGTVLECNDYDLFDAIDDYLNEEFDDGDGMTVAFRDGLCIIYAGEAISVEELERRVVLLKAKDQYVASAGSRQPCSPKPDCL